MHELWRRHRITLGAGLFGAVLGSGLTLLWFSAFVRPAPPPLRVVQPTAVATPAEVWVQVGGEVAAPGVYHLPANARVAEAIEAAGGTTTEANPQALNLAGRVRDGQRIDVPKIGQP